MNEPTVMAPLTDEIPPSDLLFGEMANHPLDFKRLRFVLLSP
jgi:hypothetical protein